MKQRIQQFLHNYRLIYRPASPLTKTVVCVAIGLCMATLITLALTQRANEKHLAELTAQAAALTGENQALSQRIDALGTAASYRQIAREELGLVDPDTIVIESEENWRK